MRDVLKVIFGAVVLAHLVGYAESLQKQQRVDDEAQWAVENAEILKEGEAIRASYGR